MTFNILRIITVLIDFLALNGYSSKVFHFSSANYEIGQSPELKFEPVQNPSSRGNYKLLNYIAEPFFAIVVLADSLYEVKNPVYYLSLYDHHREKNFFLVI